MDDEHRHNVTGTMTRPLTPLERQLIDRVAERLDDAPRKDLLADAAVATAENVADDGSIIRFHLKGYERPPYRGQHTIPVEGIAEDADGASVSVLLYQDDNGRLYELEFVRHEEGDLIGLKWETLELV